MKYVFCDCRVPLEMRKRLSGEGFTVLPIYESKGLSAPVCAHTDLSVLKIGERLLVRREVTEWYPFLREAQGVVLSDEAVLPRYPEETKFCAKVVGRTIYHGRAVATDVSELAREEGLTPCEVKQGYVACNLLVLDEGHAITSDRALARTLIAHGVDVLLICEGHITLAPYPYGFIGGTSGTFSGRVYFLGDVRMHPDGERMLCYIASLGLEAVCLGEGELFDGGGLVFWEDTTLPVCENT